MISYFACVAMTPCKENKSCKGRVRISENQLHRMVDYMKLAAGLDSATDSAPPP